MPQRTNIDTGHATIAIFVILFLTVYCQIIHFPALISLLILFSGIHLFYSTKANLKLFLHLSLLLTVILFTAHAVTTYTTTPIYYIPIASVAMLTMLLFNDLQLSFLMALMSSAVVCLAVNGNLQLMITFFLGNLTAAYIVREARTRGQLIGAGLYVSIIQVMCIVLQYPQWDFLLTKNFFLNYLRPLMINGILSSFVVIATLKIFEYIFGVLTNFSLLELTDFNQPLLKRLIMEAPGTYHHSLIVSNLAESAADAIGANGLLARVGGYYHDVGKIVKPEYFTENQMHGGNKHDHIEPSMSRLVIMNHVKEGIELAQKYKLNPKIIDFIPQHHGTSLMHFFYQRALEEASDPSSVREEHFRYPGPKPQTREAAILLLADSSEGATRALEETNPQNIEETVRKVINNKFIDGQLDECNLTLKEIERIALTFVRVLSAMYHTRVKYPEKKNNHEDLNSKPTKENTAFSHLNHQDRKENIET